MRMKWCWVLALAVTATACNRDKEDDQPQTGKQTARRDSVVRKPVYPEAEAAQILRAINEGEVAAARVARERTQNEDILRFATVMMADHRAMTALLDSLIPPIADTINAESKRIKEAGTATVDSLWRIEGGFNNTYIAKQVAAHEQALLLLDTALIPSARDAELKKLLRDLRPAVVAHLQRAKQIYAARMSNPATATPTTSRPTQPAAPQTPPAETAAAPIPVPRNTAPPPSPPTSTSNM